MGDKEQIIKLFRENVKGQKADGSSSNQRHDGKKGHWLERMMGIKANNKTEADLLGYEMKNQTRGKTTFGDWSPNWYIFKDHPDVKTRDEFLKLFGKPNSKKKGRLSWSGEPVPKIDSFNSFGQKLVVDRKKNILATYSYSHDIRDEKSILIPKSIKIDDLVIAQWNEEALRSRVEAKFNNNGWFKCLTDESGIYREIVFGSPISFDTWISSVKTGDIYFDSGMYQGNNRPYSQWRANNSFWEKLIISRHE